MVPFPVYNFVQGHLGILQDVLSKLTNGDIGNLILLYSNAIKLNFASVQFPKKFIVNDSTFKNLFVPNADTIKLIWA